MSGGGSNFTAGRAIRFEIDGQVYDQWEEAEVTRDLKEFAGTFAFTCRDNVRSLKSFEYASTIPPVYQIKPGAEVKIFVHDQLICVGFIETVCPQIDDAEARVAISGKDKAGDLIDCTARPEGAIEFNNVTLEEVAKRIAEPYGLKVRAEVDTGEAFSRYSVDLTETGLSALEKGARQRQLLLLSDGIGGLVLTRTGATRAGEDLELPGNVLSSSGTFTHEGRFSKTTVKGQSEKAAGGRDGTAAALQASGVAVPPEERQQGDGSATQQERAGTAAQGEAVDEEVKRYRPKVHLAATKASGEDCQKEADWRMRTARGKSEEITYTVWGFLAGANGSASGAATTGNSQEAGGNANPPSKEGLRPWRVNEMVHVSDAYQLVERDMLISRVTFRESDEGRITELTVTSPEAFDADEVGGRRKNKKGKKKGKAGGLDGTAEALG